ncbi:hypothetical protein CVT25_011523 [Psilocybe cyanescens]|uniref:Uncharacterized protein n=1 Tax=Psilocybe cyanescens TaxID=93625 RepID=A0A409XV48_PSICY|nr:hypothetical protein CVT25_011523 [Psilocybe cyanescens]
MHYTNYRFHNFVQDIGKGVFVDAEFHPMRWYQFNTGEALHAYFWAVLMLPSLLAKSGYSEELIAYARQVRIRRNNNYHNFKYLTLEQEQRAARTAVKAYVRRAEDGPA